MRRITLILTLAILSVLAWWLVQRGPVHVHNPEHRLGVPSEESVPNGANLINSDPEASSDATTLIALDAVDTSADPERRVESGFQVLSGDGLPVAGAAITWSPRLEAWHARVEHTAERDWEGLLQRSVAASTDGNGFANLPTRLAGDADGSVLWITHPAARARSFRIPTGGSPFGLALPIKLEFDGSVEVRVVDAQGMPVPHAVVRTTRTLLPRLRGGRPFEEIEDSLYLVRFATADSAGNATMPSLGDLQSVVASLDTRIANAWRGEAPASVTLTLNATFELRGQVRSLNDSRHFDGVVVSALARTGAEARGLASFSVDSQGAFGPQRLPILNGALYDVHAQGGEYISTRRTIETPRPDSRHFVEIPLEPGSTFPVLVVGPDETPIAGANVEYVWQAGDWWPRALVVTDHDGIARMRGSPLGNVWLDIEARGFVPKREGLLLESPVTDPWRVKLERGGTIEGVVRHEGVAVETFSIKFWRGPLADRSTRHFLGRPEGRFTIEGVPLGEVSIFALSNDLGRGPVRTVVLTEGVPTSVELEISGCVSATGRVVDALTGEPVAGAVVQPWLAQEAMSLDPFGRSGTSDDHGSFQLDCMPTGDSILRISAVGFPERGVAITAQYMNTSLQIGTITLRRGSSLDLHLILPDGVGINGWFGSLDGPSAIAPQQFPANGVLRFENLEPGRWGYTVDGPSRSARYGEVVLSSRRKSSVTVRANGTGNARVEIREKSGYPLKEPAFLYVIPETFVGDPAKRSQGYPVPPSRSLMCEIEPHVQHQLLLFDGDQRNAASLLVPASPTAPAVLHLETGAPTAQIVVVDRAGDPLTGVVVNLDSGTAAAVRRAVSDPRGLADFGPWPYPAANLHLQREDIGVGYVRSVELKENEPVRFEFNPQAVLDVLTEDGATPLPGVEVRILAPRDGEHWLMAMSTDAAGHARSRKLLAGDYILAVDGESLWPVRRTIRMSPSPQAETLQVRRRGSIAFQVMQGGLPLSGVSVQLHSVEFDQDALDWLGRDLILARPPNAATDSEGRLRFDGLPRGEYRWSVSATNQSIRTGESEIAPGACVQVRIDLD